MTVAPSNANQSDSSNLPSQYDPVCEGKWQAFWEENQIFKADPKKAGETYSVIIPPPNVTGRLHMGHAFNTALIDTLVRYHRMTGKNTLCLPGTDHASIAVQTIIENKLRAEGKTRDDLGREEFLKRTWEWKAESGGQIVSQLRRLGFSVDWSRERFTLDKGCSDAVLEAFTRLHKEGLIYRGRYLVSWCPASQSAVSDLEVESQEVNGKLWYFSYPLAEDSSQSLTVATTRPETMLGDTAVAVNPNDDRYKHLIGKMLRLPLTDRQIPIIGDDHVEMDFGTGCVKVTPAHDTNDFEMGNRHNLPFINILNKDGSLNENGNQYAGQDRFEARKNVVADLEKYNHLVKIEDYKHSVPYSDRGKVPIEPMLSTQWFVNVKPMAANALQALDNNDPAFVPERWNKVYRDWLSNLRDWCISRQLWWGHRIPAWYAISETDGKIADNTPFFVAKDEAGAREQAIAKFGDQVQLEQDPDVLDTWFSSGLWPMSTLGWPDETAEDFARYYPTSTLITGFDIIFFWVARMTMMAGHFTGKMPFETVYIHGLVRDENGAKMSKSKNNGIDPLLLIDRYGTDALRYTLIREVAGAGQDISLKYDRATNESDSVEASRNFANKLWNASRFVMLNLEGQTPLQLGHPDPEKLELADRWILSRFHQVTQTVRGQIETHALGEAAKGMYEFIWGDFCDWYIELAKSRLQNKDAEQASSRRTAQQTLATVLEGILKLLHPFMPHVTEEIWHTLTQTDISTKVSLALQPYPLAKSDYINPDLENQFTLLIGSIRTIRNLRAEAGIKPGEKIEALLSTEDDREHDILTQGWFYIKDLAKVKKLSISPPGGGTVAGSEVQFIEPMVKDRPEAIAPKTPGPIINRNLSLKDQLAIENVLDIASNFTTTYRRPLLTLGTLGIGVFVLEVILAILNTVHHVPLLPVLMELVGLGYAFFYTKDNLWQERDRSRTFTQASKLKDDVMGTRLMRAITTDQTEAIAEAAPTETSSSGQMFAGVVGTVQVLIPLAGLVDIEALRAKIEKDYKKIEGDANGLSSRLSNAKFVDKAPPEVVQGARDTLSECQKQMEILQSRLTLL
jgi:valyl-tRNA synthetase